MLYDNSAEWVLILSSGSSMLVLHDVRQDDLVQYVSKFFANLPSVEAIWTILVPIKIAVEPSIYTEILGKLAEYIVNPGYRKGRTLNMIIKGDIYSLLTVLKILYDNCFDVYSRLLDHRHRHDKVVKNYGKLKILYIFDRDPLDPSYIVLEEQKLCILVPTDMDEPPNSVIIIDAPQEKAGRVRAKSKFHLNISSVFQEYFEMYVAATKSKSNVIVLDFSSDIEIFMKNLWNTLDLFCDVASSIKKAIDDFSSFFNKAVLLYLLLNMGNIDKKKVFETYYKYTISKPMRLMVDMVFSELDPYFRTMIVNFAHFAFHDRVHSENVLWFAINHVLRGFSPDMNENIYLKLNIVERFILQLACITHDIGLGLLIPTSILGIKEEIDRAAEVLLNDLKLERVSEEDIETLRFIIDSIDLSKFTRDSYDVEDYRRLLRMIHNVYSYIFTYLILKKVYEQSGFQNLEELLFPICKLVFAHRDLKFKFKPSAFTKEKASSNIQRPPQDAKVFSLKDIFPEGISMNLNTLNLCDEDKNIAIPVKIFGIDSNDTVQFSIDERYLALVLRLADALDVVGESRSSPKYCRMFDLTKFPTDQIEHWAYKILIKDVHVEKASVVTKESERHGKGDGRYTIVIEYEIPSELFSRITHEKLIDDIRKFLEATEVYRILKDIVPLLEFKPPRRGTPIDFDWNKLFKMIEKTAGTRKVYYLPPPKYQIRDISLSDGRSRKIILEKLTGWLREIKKLRDNNKFREKLDYYGLEIISIFSRKGASL